MADKKNPEKFLEKLASYDEHTAVSALRGLQDLCRSMGGSLEDALRCAFRHSGEWAFPAEKIIQHEASPKTAAPVSITGVPEWRVPQPGILEVIAVGKNTGDVYKLPGESAHHAELIASNLKDAVVAAVINKSRFKLKLSDVRNERGEILETALQAEYERGGMAPVRIWTNSRGEVGALATVLRRLVANSLPELAAA